MRGALASPRHPPLEIPLPASPARFISLRIERPREKLQWVVTDVSVPGPVRRPHRTRRWLTGITNFSAVWRRRGS